MWRSTRNGVMLGYSREHGNMPRPGMPPPPLVQATPMSNQR